MKKSKKESGAISSADVNGIPEDKEINTILKRIRIIGALAVLVILSLMVRGCGVFGGRKLIEYKETQSFFGSQVTIQCYYNKKTNIFPVIKKCWQRLSEIQISMNSRSSVGYVARLAESGFYGVQVPDDVYGLLEDSLEYSRLTDGAFDVTISPLVRLWRDAEAAGYVPDNVSIKIAKDKVDYRLVRLEEDNMVFLQKQGMKIDLGGIAKGYAVDAAAGILRQSGVEHFLIDAGGDIYCAGKQEGKIPWKVGVQNPAKKDALIDELKLTDKAVTTSGNYERFYEIGGKKFSHIIDPTTGYPQDLVQSATVIAPTAQEADAFSTALCVLGAKKGIDIINALDDVEAMVVQKKKDRVKIYKSKRYNDLR